MQSDRPGPSLDEPGKAKGLARVETIVDTSHLETLEREWIDLWDVCPTATPFQRPEWVIPWAKALGPDTLWTLAARENGVLVGLALWFRNIETSGRRVAFLGGRESDYHELLYRPESAQRVVARVHDHVVTTATTWDHCDLQQLPPRSPLLRTLAPARLRVDTMPGEGCPILPLAEHAPLSASVPAHQLARYRKYLRRAERSARVDCIAVDADHAGALFDAFLRLHDARWQTRGGTAALGDPRVVAFHRQVVARMAESGLLRLYALRRGGSLMAALYGFAGKRTLYCYLQGLDPTHVALSPGMLLVGSVISNSLSEGLLAVDFLRGDEPYKFSWGATMVPTHCQRWHRENAP